MSGLSDSDYNDLLPFRDIIRRHRESGGSRQCPEAHQVMARVRRDRIGEETNFSCGDCIFTMYNQINALLDHYERQNPNT